MTCFADLRPEHPKCYSYFPWLFPTIGSSHYCLRKPQEPIHIILVGGHVLLFTFFHMEVLGMWNIIHMLDFFLEFHHPNWLSYSSAGWLNHQPVSLVVSPRGFIMASSSNRLGSQQPSCRRDPPGCRAARCRTVFMELSRESHGKNCRKI